MTPRSRMLSANSRKGVSSIFCLGWYLPACNKLSGKVFLPSSPESPAAALFESPRRASKPLPKPFFLFMLIFFLHCLNTFNHFTAKLNIGLGSAR